MSKVALGDISPSQLNINRSGIQPKTGSVRLKKSMLVEVNEEPKRVSLTRDNMPTQRPYSPDNYSSSPITAADAVKASAPAESFYSSQRALIDAGAKDLDAMKVDAMRVTQSPSAIQGKGRSRYGEADEEAESEEAENFNEAEEDEGMMPDDDLNADMHADMHADPTEMDAEVLTARSSGGLKRSMSEPPSSQAFSLPAGSAKVAVQQLQAITMESEDDLMPFLIKMRIKEPLAVEYVQERK